MTRVVSILNEPIALYCAGAGARRAIVLENLIILTFRLEYLLKDHVDNLFEPICRT